MGIRPSHLFNKARSARSRRKAVFEGSNPSPAANKGKFIPEGYQLYLSMVLGYPKVMPDHKAPRRENVETWL